MNRATLIAYLLAALFLVVAIVALIARPLHYERTLVAAVILAVASAAYGRRKETSARS